MADKEVVRFGPYGKFIASGVKAGETIYLSGQVSISAEGTVVGPGDPVAQVRQAYVNVAEVLEKFGVSMSAIVDETWFVTDIALFMENIGPIWAARDEAFGGQAQVTQTLIQVAALADPEMLCEIKCVAHA